MQSLTLKSTDILRRTYALTVVNDAVSCDDLPSAGDRTDQRGAVNSNHPPGWGCLPERPVATKEAVVRKAYSLWDPRRLAKCLVRRSRLSRARAKSKRPVSNSGDQVARRFNFPKPRRTKGPPSTAPRTAISGTREPTSGTMTRSPASRVSSKPLSVLRAGPAVKLEPNF